jgi:hypothetical protein
MVILALCIIVLTIVLAAYIKDTISIITAQDKVIIAQRAYIDRLEKAAGIESKRHPHLYVVK